MNYHVVLNQYKNGVKTRKGIACSGRILDCDTHIDMWVSLWEQQSLTPEEWVNQEVSYNYKRILVDEFHGMEEFYKMGIKIFERAYRFCVVRKQENETFFYGGTDSQHDHWSLEIVGNEFLKIP